MKYIFGHRVLLVQSGGSLRPKISLQPDQPDWLGFLQARQIPAGCGRRRSMRGEDSQEGGAVDHGSSKGEHLKGLTHYVGL